MIPRLSPFIYKDGGGGRTEGRRRQPVTIATLSHKTPPATFVSRSGKKKQNTQHKIHEFLSAHEGRPRRACTRTCARTCTCTCVRPLLSPQHGHFPPPGHTQTLTFTHSRSRRYLIPFPGVERRGAERSGAALRTPSMSAFESRQNNQLAAAESEANESVSSGGR